LTILSNRLKISSDFEFWQKVFETFETKIDLNKLDVFHKTNLLWIIAAKKSMLGDHDYTRFIRSLTRELEKQFFESESSKPERYLG
jgi:hypothetical protein